jgi:hypothetical protein
MRALKSWSTVTERPAIPRNALILQVMWPLTKEALANGLFEEIEEVEEALVRRCVELLDQPEAIRELANYLGGPRRKRSSRRHEVPSIIHPDSV